MECIKEINSQTDEGKLLMMAIAKLSGEGKFSHMHPDNILREISETVKEVYPDPGEIARKLTHLETQVLMSEKVINEKLEEIFFYLRNSGSLWVSDHFDHFKSMIKGWAGEIEKEIKKLKREAL